MRAQAMRKLALLIALGIITAICLAISAFLFWKFAHATGDILPQFLVTSGIAVFAFAFCLLFPKLKLLFEECKLLFQAMSLENKADITPEEELILEEAYYLASHHC